MVSFRSVRQMFISFAKTVLGYGDNSTFFKELKRLSLILVRSRREHHPFSHSHLLIDVGRRINSSNRWGHRAADYRSWIFSVTLIGVWSNRIREGRVGARCHHRSCTYQGHEDRECQSCRAEHFLAVIRASSHRESADATHQTRPTDSNVLSRLTSKCGMVLRSSGYPT